MNEQEVKEILEHWTKILGLENENIGYSEKPLGLNSQPAAHTIYSSNDGYWIILYDNNCTPQTIVHEIGHIYLYVLLNYTDIKKAIPEEIHKISDKIIDPKIKSIKDVLLDCFANYRLCLHEEYKLLFTEVLIKHLSYRLKGPSSSQLVYMFSDYMYFYISINYILSESVRRQYNTNINDYFKYIKSSVIAISKKRNKSITQKTFIKLNQILNKFENFKETKDFGDIITFIYEIGKFLPYWKKEYVLRQLNIIFKKEIPKPNYRYSTYKNRQKKEN